MGNTIQNNNEIRLRTYCDNLGRMRKSRNLIHVAGWNGKLLQLPRGKVWKFLKKLNIELLYDPTILLSGYTQENCKYMFTQNNFIPPFIAALFVMGKRQNQSKFPSADEWINKICLCDRILFNHKRSEVLVIAVTWLNHENVMLRERDKTCTHTHAHVV